MKTQRRIPATAKTPRGRKGAHILAGSIAVLVGSIAGLLAPNSAQAATYYWDTNALTGFGSVTGGWDGANLFWNTDITGATSGTFIASPTAADDLFLNGGTAGTITITGTGIGSSLTLSNNVANTITGGILQLGGTGTSSGLFLTNAITTAQAVSSAIALNAASTIQNAGTGVLTISGGITGAQNLTLKNNGATASGITISGTSLNNTGTVTNSGTGGGTLISAIIGANVTGVTQNGASTLTLSGANTGFTGAINVNAGTLAITHNDALGTTAGATTVNGSNGTTGIALSLSSATSGLTIAENINLFGSAAGRATLINDSAQSHILNGAINVTSDTNLAQFNSSNNAGSITVNGDITGTLANGAVLFVRGGSTNANNRILGSVNLTGGNFAKTDAGTWLVGATGKTYIWSNTTLANGTLKMGAANVLSLTTGTLLMGETGVRTPTLDLNGFSQTVTGITYNTGTGTRTITSASAATLTVNNATDSTTTGSGADSIILTGSLGLTKQGTGALSLNGANTFTGAVTIAEGQLNAGSTTGFGLATATTSVTLGNASTVGIANYTAGAASSTRPFVVGGAAGGQLLNNGSGLLTLTAAAPILNLSAGPLTIGGSANITLTPAALAVPVTGGNALTKIGAGTVTLNTSGTGTSATISGATPIIITAGTLQQISTQNALAANSLGTGLIKFNPVNGGTATLGMSFASVTNTYSNTINVDKPATGTSTSIISVSAGATFSGPIVLGTGAGTGIPTLRFTNTNGSLFTVTATGGITGTGNIVLNGTGANAPITISGTGINITGSITNTGTNSAATSVATISAPITTTNLTAISQQGATPFAISSALALTSALNSFTSTGTGLWTFSGAITGAQPLTLNANSTGGISYITGAVGNGGVITNQGSGTNNVIFGGTVLSTAAAGGNTTSAVTGIVQNSLTSTLTFQSSTASTFAGPISIKAGTLGLGGIGSAGGTGVVTNVITLGDAATNLSATLRGINSFTYNQPIVIADTSAGTQTIDQGTTAAAVFSGNITTSNPFQVVAASSGSVTLSGNITNTSGTGNNISLVNDSTAATGLSLSGTSINPVGAITNTGSGTGLTQISGALGTSVTDVQQNSLTSTLQISGSQDLYLGTMTVTQGVMRFQTTAAVPNWSGGANQINVASGATFGLNVATGGWSDAEINTLVGGTVPIGLVAGSRVGFDTGATNVTVAANITDIGAYSLNLNKLGTGTLTLTGTNTYSGQTIINAGQLIASGASLSPNSNLNLFGTAVFTPTANFARPEGTGGGQMQISGGTAGFSSNVVGGLTVAFGTLAVPTTVTWGNATFNPTALVLNDATATTTINLSSPIDFNAASRTVTVGSSTAATAATLSGQLTGATGGLTKTGAGILNVTNTTNSYAGATTLTTGTLSFNGGGSGPGGMALPSGTAVNVNAGTFQVLNDTAGTLAYGNTVNLGGTQTITVGNNGGITTGSTVALGQLNAPATALATATTTTFSSPNNYTTSFTGLALPGGTGNNTILIANSNVVINGNVTNRGTGAPANFDTLFLRGTATGNFINGVIADAPTGSITAGNYTPVTKTEAGTWTLTGANTYTGATTVSNGVLRLQDLTSATRATGFQVVGGSQVILNNPAGTLNVVGNVNIGTGLSTLQNTQGVVVAGVATGTNGNISLLDTTLNTLRIKGNAFAGVTNFLTLGTTVAAQPSGLSFDIGNADTDQIVVTPSAISGSGKLLLQLGGATITLNQLPSTSITAGTYNLLTFAAGSTFTGAFSLASAAPAGLLYNLKLNNASPALATAQQLEVLAGAGAGNVYWRGDLGTVWNTGLGTTATNFRSDYAGTTATALPTGSTNVFFTASNAAPANFASTTLGQGMGMNSLNFIGAAPTDTNPVGIGGTLPLTINAAAGFSDQVATAYAAGIGLVMQSGAAATTISAPVILGGNQTWQLDSTNGLTSSGAISGAASLTKTGTGTLTLGGANTFSGGLTISNGTVLANVSNATTVSGAAGPSTSTITLGGAGNSVNLLANSFTVSNPVILGSVGANTATIGNNGTTTTATFSGGINLNGIDLTLTATGTTGTTTVSGLISGTGNLNYTPVVGTQVTVNQASYTGNTTLATAGTVNLNQSGASNTFSLLSTGQVNLSGGGILKVKADGAGTGQSIITGNGVTGNNVVVGTGGGTLDVNRTSANSANAFVFNNLSINASQLNVLGASNYAAAFAGTTTLTGAATLSATTASLNLLGKVTDGGNLLTVSGTPATGTVRLFNTATGGSANALTNGTISINGGSLLGYAPAAGAAAASNSLGNSTIAFSGTNPILHLAPVLGSSLTGGTTAGLLSKGYTGATSLAANNFLNPSVAVAGMSGNFAYLNVGAGGGTIANVPIFGAAAAFTATTSFQITGLLNITTAGNYLIGTATDDFGSLVVDGNAPVVSAVNTVNGGVYLTAGLHTINYRAGNNGTNGTIGLQYQGPDQPVLGSIPASAFFSATNSADLSTTFANNLTVAASTNATVDIPVTTTVGTVTFGGTGGTLNVTGSGNLNVLTLGAVTTNGTSTLAPGFGAILNVPNVTGSAAGTDTLVLGGTSTSTVTANQNTVSGVIADGPSAGTLALVKSGPGIWTLSGSAANTYSGGTIVNGNGTAGNATFAPLILAKTAGVNAIPAGTFTIGNGSFGFATVQLGASDQIADSNTINWNSSASNFGYFQMLGNNETVAGLNNTDGAGVVENMEAQVINTNSTLTLAGSGTYSFNGFLRNRSGGAGTGLLNINITGGGTQTFSGTNIGASGGIITLSGGSTLGLTGTTANVFAVNYAAASTGTLQINTSSQVGGLATVDATNSGNIVQNAAGTNSVLTVNQANVTTFGGVIRDNPTSNTLGLTKSGVGQLTLAGANAYSGLTTVSAGTLTITGTNTLNSPITMTTGGAGVLNINSTGVINAGTVTWGGATAGAINLLGGTLQLNAATGMTSSNATANTLVFNGGTLKSGAVTTISGNINITVAAGGGTVDTTGGNITSSSGFGNTASPGTLNVTGGNVFQSGFGATLTGAVNITGAGTTVRFGSASTPAGLWTVGAGAFLDLNNVSASVGGLTGSGNVLNTGASTARVLTITGTGGNTFSGAIQQPTVSSTLTTGVTVNLSSTSATQTFSGAHNYSGATTITQGKLALTGGSLDNTAISVAVNGTIAPLGAAGSFTAGNSTTALLGASLNIASGGTLDMQDINIGTFTLTQNASFATAALTLNSSNLFFDIGSAGPDQIVVNGGLIAGVFTGTNIVNLTGVGSSLTLGTYNLITSPGITAGNTAFKFSNGLSTMSLPVGLLSYPLTLQGIAGFEQIVVGAGLGNFTWTGKQDGLAANADNSIWTATPAANNNFADASPAVQDYTNGSSVTFQDLNVISAANVTNSIVNIDAAGVLPGAVTVNNNAVNYTINTSGSVGIAGAIGLDKTGTGTLTLSSVNTYSGTTNINGGIVNVGIGTALGSGTIAFGGGTLQYGTGVTTDFSNRFNTSAGELISIDTNGNNVTYATALTSVGGTLTKSGTGILTLPQTAAASNTYSGATVINGGTLKITGGGANGAVGGVLSGTPTITVNNGGTLLIEANVAGTSADLLGFTVGKEQIIINSGGTVLNNTVGPSTGNRQTLQNALVMTGGTLGGNSNGDANRGAYSINAGVNATSDAAGNPALINTVGTGTNDGISLQFAGGNIFNVNRGPAVSGVQPDMIISSPIRQYATVAGSLTKSGNGILRLSGANTYTTGTNITAGTLQLGSATALPAGVALTMSGTGILDLFGNSASIGALTSVAGNTITNNSPSTGDSTAMSLNTPSGAGVYVDALNTATGLTTIASLITDGPTRKTQITLNNANGGASFANTANTFSGGVVLTHNGTVNGGTRLSPGVVTGTPYGTGPIIIGQTATDKAGIFFANATTFNNPIIFNTALGTDRVGIRAEAALTLTGVITANLAPATFTSNNASAGNVLLTGQITGASGLVLDITSLASAATSFNVTLNNSGTANDYAGNTVVNLAAATGKSATLTLGQANQIPNGTGKGNVVLNTTGTGVGRLNMAGFSETINGLSGSGTVDGTSGTPTLTLGDGDATGNNFSGIIRNTAGTLAVTKIGTGTQTLSGNNSYTGATTISNGTLQVPTIANNGVAQPLGQATSAIGLGNASTAGTLEYTGAGAADLQRDLTVGGVGGGIVKNSGGNTLTLSGTLTKTGNNLTLTGGMFLVSGQITGTAAANSDLIVNGGATVTLTNANNNYDGPTRINAGATLKNGVLNAVPTGSSIVLGEATGNTAGTYDLAGFNQTITALSHLGTGSRLVTNSAAGSGTNTLTHTGTSSFGGVIQDGATAKIALTKSTGGSLTLSGANTFTGATTINAGTLELDSTGSLTATSSVAVNAGGTLLLGDTQQINDAAGLTLNGGTFTTAGHSETMGTLTLSLNSTIQLTTADNSQNLRFTDYDRTGGLLTINNWTATANTSGTAGRLLFATTANFTTTELSEIQFTAFNQGAMLISFGGGFNELVPVPEPTTFAAALGLLGLAGWSRRRRTHR